MQFEPALNGFSDINRYYDKRHKIVVAKILPGEFYVTKSNELVTTVLGSCISACVWDHVMGVGGMNHFMLPLKGEVGFDVEQYSCRYGNWAMEYLINEVLKNGGSRKNLKCKIFGGGKIVANMSDVGQRNIEFVCHYLEDEGIDIDSQDVGGPWPRKVYFHPSSGKVQLKRLKSLHNSTIQQRETEYMQDIKSHEQDAGDVELF